MRPRKKGLDTNREVWKEYCYGRLERGVQDTAVGSTCFQEDMYNNGK